MNKTKYKKFRNKLTTFLLATFFLIFALTLILGKVFLRAYRVYNDRKLVAIVDCRKESQDSKTFLDITLIKDKDEKKVSFEFDADEWVFEGRIVKWSPFLGILPLKSYYRVERITSRYYETEREKSAPRIVVALSEERDPLWRFFYRIQKLAPFIEAVYGMSAFMPFEPGEKFHVYVTSTGFLIKPVSFPKKRIWWTVG